MSCQDVRTVMLKLLLIRNFCHITLAELYSSRYYPFPRAEYQFKRTLAYTSTSPVDVMDTPNVEKQETIHWPHQYSVMHAGISTLNKPEALSTISMFDPPT